MLLLKREYELESDGWYGFCWTSACGQGFWDYRTLCDESIRNLWHLPKSCRHITLSLFTKPGRNRWPVHIWPSGSGVTVFVYVIGTGWLISVSGNDMRYLTHKSGRKRKLYLQCEYAPTRKKQCA